jgi:3-mercaptopyruvate sulfurtransferase SseA
MLAYAIAFNKISALYDGSWSEWAERQNLKVSLRSLL